jgi:hypothetical protein
MIIKPPAVKLSTAINFRTDGINCRKVIPLINWKGMLFLKSTKI